MLAMTDPYKLKAKGDGITPHKDWGQQEEEIMEKLVREKFIQNKKLREKFLTDPYDCYYEMTSDQKWGTGKRIMHDTDLVDVKELTGQNKLGQILVKIKSELDWKQRSFPAQLKPSTTDQTGEESLEGAVNSVSPETSRALGNRRKPKPKTAALKMAEAKPLTHNNQSRHENNNGSKHNIMIIADSRGCS